MNATTQQPAPDFGEKYWPLPWFNETDLGCYGNIISANNEPVAQVQPLSPALEPDIVKRNKWRNHVAARISATMNACAGMVDPAAEIQALRLAAPVWQPIETAPRDGTRILVNYRTIYDSPKNAIRARIEIGWFKGDRLYLSSSEGHEVCNLPNDGASNWMPLPTPPTV